MANRPPLTPVRAVAVALSLAVGCYFMWAAVTDRPTSRLAWFAVVAVQCLNVAILLKDRRNKEGDG